MITRFLHLAGVALAAALILCPASLLAQPPPATFEPDGSIRRGEWRLTMRRDGVLNLVTPGGATADLFVHFHYKGKPEFLTPAKMKDPRLEVDTPARTTRFSAMVTPPGRDPFPFVYEITLTPEGRARVRMEYELEEPVREWIDHGSRMHLPRHELAGSSVRYGETFVEIERKPPGERERIATGIRDSVSLHAGEPHREVTFHPGEGMSFALSDTNLVGRTPPHFELIFNWSGNRLTYEIELPEPAPVEASAETFGGVDFFKADRLRMPDYNASRNLVQNPGFEAGFRYWRWNTFGRMPAPSKRETLYETSPEAPHTGRRSLALWSEPGLDPVQAATFAIPVTTGQTYTLSFYARSPVPNARLAINVQGRFVTSTFPVWKQIPISARWERHTFTFQAPDPFLSIGFGHHSPKEEGWVYVDSVQLEEGGTATPFSTKAVSARLEGGQRGRLWEPGEKPEARLLVQGSEPGTRGTVTIRERNFFDETTDRGTLPFKLDAQGEAAIPLPWADELSTGIYTYELDIRTEAGLRTRDADRFTVLPFLSNQHRHKNIFAAHLSDRYPEWRRDAAFFARTGIGSVILFDPNHPAFHAALDEQGILRLSSIFDSGDGFRAMKWSQRDGFDLSEEQLGEIEKLAFEKASRNLDTRYWKLNNEPPLPPYIDNLPAMRKMNRALAAARRGVLRANPDALIIGSDPSNMYSGAGMAFIRTQLEAAGEEKIFDIVAIHPYRARPEEPDRDAETAQFLGILDAQKFKGDVWFTEGIYHQNYHIPDWDLNVHKGCSSDRYRAGPLSYFMGWGERMAAAYTARSWLVALKYGDRVKLDVDWGYRINAYSDIDYTPMASVFAANTLGNLLGNAEFRHSPLLGYDCRSYVFENEKHQPVAVLWQHRLEVDTGGEEGPILHTAPLAEAFPGLHYRDFMGGRHPLGKELRLSPFPVFIEGPENSMEAFMARLVECGLADPGASLHAWLEVTPEEKIALRVENGSSRPFEGKLRLRDRKGKVLLEEDARITMEAPWNKALSPVAASLGGTLELVSENATRSLEVAIRTREWPRSKIAVSFTGKAEEWKDAASWPLERSLRYGPYGLSHEKMLHYRNNPVEWGGDADFSARAYAKWDEKNLYLAFRVRDDKHHPFESHLHAWRGDSVQVYFDGWADARRSHRTGYGPDDQSFQIWSDLKETRVFRDVAPERQLAFLDSGLVANARAASHRLEDGVTFYEIALPLADLNPIPLEPGTRFGFAVITSDNDGDYRKGALTDLEAEEPNHRPDLYPTVILRP